MDDKQKSSKILKSIQPKRIIYPILIGLGVVVYMLYKEIDIDTFKAIQFTWYTLFWLCVALGFMAIRDIGYMIRLKILTEGEISWKKIFRIIMLWEFASAVTPSAIGGTSVAILFVNKEGISLGKSSSVVMSTSFLDELYFIIMFPLLAFTLNLDQLFMGEGTGIFENSLFWLALTGYSLKLVYLITLTYGLFFNPRGLKWLILWVFRLPILKRWRNEANQTGTEIIQSSKELRHQSFKFWIKAFGATALSWTARYWVVNLILLAFFFQGYNFMEHIMIFARQLIMWIMMLVSPTPGGSGFSEWVFTKYLGEFLPNAGIATSIALIWRLISYYPYLFIGIYMFPRWLKSKF
ncbi:MAG: flippase-like domain-containing protein [Marinifilaceae bacterium]|jgi:uncharacterized protein (TIRG00374 family)|nr:flippase-like domain-containing protein [Marinifilaceae bacterium]